MEKQTKIVDASVAVKWFVKEENFEKAIELRNKHLSKEIILIVPNFLYLEVINALRYKEKNESKLKNVKNHTLKYMACQ